MFLEISQNSQENTEPRVSFLIKKQAEACNFIKKETLTQVFSCKFWEVSKSNIFYRALPVAASVIVPVIFDIPLTEILKPFHMVISRWWLMVVTYQNILVRSSNTTCITTKRKHSSDLKSIYINPKNEMNSWNSTYLNLSCISYSRVVFVLSAFGWKKLPRKKVLENVVQS